MNETGSESFRKTISMRVHLLLYMNNAKKNTQQSFLKAALPHRLQFHIRNMSDLA